MHFEYLWIHSSMCFLSNLPGHSFWTFLWLVSSTEAGASTRHFSSYSASLHRCATLPSVRMDQSCESKAARIFISVHNIVVSNSCFHSFTVSQFHSFTCCCLWLFFSCCGEIPSTSAWLSSSSVMPPASAQEAKAWNGMFPV